MQGGAQADQVWITRSGAAEVAAQRTSNPLGAYPPALEVDPAIEFKPRDAA